MLARHGRRGRRRRRQPARRTSTRGCATCGRTCASSAASSRTSPSPCDAIVFLQTIEHIEDPGALLARLRRGGRRSRYVSTPNRLTLAPAGAEKSDNPWHLREYTAAEYRALLEPRFARVELFGLFHARKLRAARARDPRRLGPRPPGAAHHEAVLRPLRAGDRRLRLRASARGATPTSTGRSTSSPSATRERRVRGSGAVGDLAIVLHSPHALRRGLRHLPVRRGVAVRRRHPLLRAGARGRRPPDDDRHARCSPTSSRPPGVAERLARVRAASSGVGSCEADADDAGRRLPRRLRGRGRALPRGARAARGRSAATCSALFAEPRRAGRVELIASTATHAVLPLRRDARRRAGSRSTPGCARTGAASARPAASGCPSAPTSPGSSGCSPSAGSATSASTRAPTSAPLAALGADRHRRRPGRVPDRLGGGRVAVVAGRLSRPTRSTPTSTASRCAGTRPWSIGGGAVRPGGGRGARARAGARVRSPRSPRGSSASPPSAGGRGLIVFAIDTELLGHWWWEGPTGSRRSLRLGAGARASSWSRSPRRSSATAPERAAAAPRRAGARARTCAPGTRRAVADLAWARAAARAAAAARARATALAPRRAPERAARELLAVQASDWAFLDRRRQAGDYPWQRATDHARALLEAIHSARPAGPAPAQPGAGPEPRPAARALEPTS